MIKKDLDGIGFASKEDIDKLQGKYFKSDKIIDELLERMSSEDEQQERTACWLLKKLVENGKKLSAKQNEKFFKSLGGLRNWVSILVSIQCVQYLIIPKQSKKMLDAYLAKNIDNKNKFIRAETFGALNELANQYPEFREDVNELLREGLNDDAASVNAKIRKIFREMDKVKSENIY